MTDTAHQLDCIFKPRSIAIIGASDVITKWGYRMVDRPLHTGYQGEIYPVNPQANSILGLRTYSSVTDIPGNVDLAVITVKAEQVPAVMKDCIKKGIHGVILISAGFAETGVEGKALQDEVVRIARSGNIRFVGPNGMGIWSAAGSMNNAFDILPNNGEIAFISQSGTFGGYMSEMANNDGYGLRSFVSIGNQADLTCSDYIEYFAQDDGTKAIILYVEGIKDGKRFFQTCREALRRKPIILYKGGSSPAGARATMSHTASIAGSEIVFQNACRQLGLIRTEETFQIFEMAIALIGQPLPPGRRIGILGTGGQGVVSVDACQHLGLEVPELDSVTSALLMKMLPPHAPVPRNPVDFAGSFRTTEDEANVVEELMKLDYIDGIISNVPINFLDWGPRYHTLADPQVQKQLAGTNDRGMRQFCALPQKYGKPIACVRWSSDVGNNDIVKMLVESGIPVYNTPEQCARSMHALVQYSELRRSLQAHP